MAGFHCSVSLNDQYEIITCVLGLPAVTIFLSILLIKTTLKLRFYQEKLRASCHHHNHILETQNKFLSNHRNSHTFQCDIPLTRTASAAYVVYRNFFLCIEHQRRSSYTTVFFVQSISSIRRRQQFQKIATNRHCVELNLWCWPISLIHWL